MTPDRPAVGIRRKRDGWQAYIRIHGRLLNKSFPHSTPLPVMKTWRAHQRAKATLSLPLGVDDGATFAADCQRYLTAVADMPTIRDRTYRIAQWRLALGSTRARTTITPLEIQSTLAKWHTDGMCTGTLNLRRTALMHLYTTLDRHDQGAVNPVRAVPRYREVPPPLILPSLADAVRAVAACKHAYATRAGSKTYARLQVLLWTGWPAKQLTQLEPPHVDWQAGTALVRGRTKGAGTRDRRLPLLPQALRALQAFRTADAWGPFDNHSLRKALHHGCRKAQVPPFRVYDLRHLFGTTVATIAKDDRVVAELLMHTDTKQTRRYTEASVNARVLAGLQRVSRVLSGGRK